MRNSAEGKSSHTSECRDAQFSLKIVRCTLEHRVATIEVRQISEVVFVVASIEPIIKEMFTPIFQSRMQ